MTASALPLDFMTVESSTRWLPRRPKPSAQSQGGCAASGLTTGQQSHSFGRLQNGVLALPKSRVTSQINLLRTLTEVPENQQRNARRKCYLICPIFDGSGRTKCVFEAPDDETAAAVLLAADMLGNIRTQTLRAFTPPEMEKILATVP